MHELSVTEGILKIARDAAGGRKIIVIHLLIGDLSSIVDDSIQFYFDMLSKGTEAEGAVLDFQRRPATVRCGDCGRQFEVRPPLPAACFHCSSSSLKVTGGRELRVDSIEVDDGGD